MRVFAVIERPAVIRQILDHLGLATAAPSFRAPPDPPASPVAVHSRDRSYDPLVDNLPIPDPTIAWQ